MKIEKIREWIVALRSGKYNQGKYYLKYTYGDDCEENRQYCCLGVLCDINGALWDESKCDKGVFTIKDGNHPVRGMLPNIIMSLLNITPEISNSFRIHKKVNPYAWGKIEDIVNREEARSFIFSKNIEEGVVTSISMPYLNDSLDFTFEEIAEVLEGYIKDIEIPMGVPPSPP